MAAKINYLRANAVFTRVLQQLYQAGVLSATAWETAAGAVPNLYLADRFLEGKRVVEHSGRLKRRDAARGTAGPPATSAWSPPGKPPARSPRRSPTWQTTMKRTRAWRWARA